MAILPRGTEYGVLVLDISWLPFSAIRQEITYVVCQFASPSKPSASQLHIVHYGVHLVRALRTTMLAAT